MLIKAKLLELLGEGLEEHHSGELRRESAEAKGERIISEELRRLKWDRKEWGKRRKSDASKLAMAARSRRETTLTMREIAARLHMGSWKSLNAKLHQWREANEEPT